MGILVTLDIGLKTGVGVKEKGKNKKKTQKTSHFLKKKLKKAEKLKKT